MSKVVTYMVPGGYGPYLAITRRQERMLKEAGVWPRNRHGSYACVHFGLRHGRPSFTEEQIARGIEDGKLSDEIALV